MILNLTDQNKLGFLQWGKIISSDNNQNIVGTKKNAGVNVSFSVTPSLVFHGLFCQTKT